MNRRRVFHRDQIVTVIKNEFSSTANSHLVVHWDKSIFKRNSYARGLRQDVISYVEVILSTKDKKFIPRGDYLEMLELCLIVLGKPIPNYNFHVPHACSHSRWMSKVIYNLKMYFFRGQLNFSKAEIGHLQDICLFICLIYVKPWIQWIRAMLHTTIFN